MSNFKSVPIGDLVVRVQSWNPAREHLDDTFDYIDLSAVDQVSKRIVGAHKITCKEAPSRARQLVLSGDILVSTVRPNLNGVAKVPLELNGATASTGFCVLRPRSGLLVSSYVYHWVRSPRFVGDMVSKATGASYPAVSDRIIFESLIPCPSISEQSRIAAILDQVDALRAKRQEALRQLDCLTQSIFIEMFGDPIKNPKGWERDALGNVVKTTSGGTPDRSVSNYYGGTIPWVKSGELHQRTVTVTEEYITELGLANSSAKIVPPGTVLVAMYGATVGAVSKLEVSAASNQAICCMQPSEKILPDYLVAFMQQYTPTLLVRRVGGAQPNLSQELLRNIQILVPPIKAQQEFSLRLKSVEKLIDRHSESVSQFDALFASLQNKAFQGEL